MKKSEIVPDKLEEYVPFSARRFTEKKHIARLVYRKGKDKIEVLYWQRYPSYDFIFGFPARSNRLYGKEAAFFQYRDTRHKKIISGFYLDKTELKQFVRGFNMIWKHWKKR